VAHRSIEPAIVRIAALAGLMLGVAVADMSCASAPTSGNKRPVEGRFLFEESMQMVIYRTAVDINGGTGEACIEVESSSPIFWLQFERWQNVDVRIDDYTEMPRQGSCSRTIGIRDPRAVKVLGGPLAIPAASEQGLLDEGAIAHANDIRAVAERVVDAIRRHDTKTLDAVIWIDEGVAALQAKSRGKRPRFDFIASHAREFLGEAAVAQPRFLLRQYPERETRATACVCRVKQQCSQADGHDAPVFGSWADRTFCFQVAYVRVEGEPYQPSGWQLVDRAFNEP